MADHRLQIVLAAKDVTGTAFTKLQGRMAALTKSVFSLKGGLVAMAGAYGMKLAATAALDVASSFEMMQVKLDALTKGKGAETLERINAWALEIPVNTRKAVDTFAMMQAMGLDPTIAKMQTLVDTSSIFGEESMPRVARALGQMATLGKLSAEELNQMSEAGINARKYLTEAFGMTVEELQKSQVSIEEIIDAIWQGLDADFGGAATKAQDSWQGMVATFKSYMEEIAKQVMDAGVFELIKSHLKDVNAGLKEWIANNEALIKQKVPEFLNSITAGISKFIEYANLRSVSDTFTQGAKLAAQDLLDWQKFTTATFLERQKMVDAILNRGTGAMDFDTHDANASLASYKEALTPVVTETNNLATATNKVKEAIDKEAEAMAAVYERQFDVTVESYTNKIKEMTAAEAEAASEMAKFQTEVDKMNGIMSDTSTWDIMQDQLKKTADATKRAGNTIGSNLGTALTDIVTKAKTAKEAFADFAKSTLNWIAKLLMKQAMSSIFSSFNFGGAGAAAGTAAAHGALFDQSGMVPFARGGIVNRPAIFPFASGIGLMGEAGPEAILPLTRTSGGDLGVKTEGGGGGTTIIINANDAKSFDDMIRRNPASIVKVIDDALTGNMSLRSTMRRTM